VVAVLFDYACHPTVLGHTNLRYSADYPAATRRVLRAALQETEGVETHPWWRSYKARPATRAPGSPAGRHVRRSRPPGRHPGRRPAARRPERRGGATWRRDPMVLRSTCTVPTRPLPHSRRGTQTLAAAEKAWAALDPGDGPETLRSDSREPAVRAHWPVRAARGRAARRVGAPDQRGGTGDVAWAHLPVEPFTCFGDQIRAAARSRTPGRSATRTAISVTWLTIEHTGRAVRGTVQCVRSGGGSTGG